MVRGKSRANSEGSVFYDKKRKRWIGRVSVPGTAGRRRRSATGRTRAEAEQKMQRLRAEVNGLTFAPERLTFAEHLDRWLEDDAKGRIKSATYIKYEGIIRNHLKPALGHVRLTDLTPAHLQSLYAQKTREGKSSGTVRQIHAVASAALRRARRWRLIQTNPAEDADPPKFAPVRESKALSREDAVRLLERILAWREDRYALFLLAVTAGMRQGEILALRWKDVDLEKGVARIERTVRTWTLPPQFGTPKGGKARTVKLTSLAVDALRLHKKQQNEERLRARRWTDQGLVFTGPKGDVIRRSVLHESFVRLLKREGFPAMTFHELRHSCATLLLEAREDLKTVQELLGHTDARTTLSVYSHATARTRQSAADKMDELLGI
jgi:integrase